MHAHVYTHTQAHLDVVVGDGLDQRVDQRHLGYFADEEEAARAWDDRVREHGLQEERGVHFPRAGERSCAEIEAERAARLNQAIPLWMELRKLEAELKRRGATAAERNRAIVRARRAAGHDDSPFRGVRLHEESGKWRATVVVDYPPGWAWDGDGFEDEEDAARAVDATASCSIM